MTNKERIRTKVEELLNSASSIGHSEYLNGGIHTCITLLDFIDTLPEEPHWCPSSKQIESLRDLLKYNIGVFDYQKFMEVNSLYDGLTKILDAGAEANVNAEKQ